MPMNLNPSISRRLVLASSSRYRQALLAKLGLVFEAVAPDIDETPRPAETAAALSARLALEKAQALAGQFPEHLIIGSDQVALLDGLQLGKPGNHAATVAQLQACAGNTVEFLTSVCVLDAATGKALLDTDCTRVRFRALTGPQIERYVQREQPYDCAGGFKSEALGIALLATLETGDPNALVGLPLIRLVRLLEAFGVDVL